MAKECVVIQAGEVLNSLKVQFSDDAKWMFVCCGSNVQVYSYSSRGVVYTLSHHSSDVTGALLNPKNRMQLISSSLDGHLALWDYTDGSLLRVIDLEVPLFGFGIRPGIQEPSLFLVVQNAQLEKVVVGLPSHVITDRQPAVAPSNQLSEAQEFITFEEKNHNDIVFSSEGRYLVSHNGKKLLVYDLERERLHSYQSGGHAITALVFHPTKHCIATGNTLGQIRLWYDFARLDAQVITTTLHWHTHPVKDLCFTSDGTYLLSGGEESVLVVWQLDMHKRTFRPRLGSPITRVSCSPGDTYFTLSLQSNVIRLVSGMDVEVECTLGSLRKAHTQVPSENGIKTGLVLHPHSHSIALNSTPGLLQFYRPEGGGSVTLELDVVGLNYVSRPWNDPLVLTTIDHVAFSPDGLWLATVEGRDDKKTAPELRMKFWEFSQPSFSLNTCVDPPHNQRVTSLTFQPKRITAAHKMSTQENFGVQHLAVTSSIDGRFKMWVLVGSDGRRTSGVSSWACRSVGYYHDLPCLGAAFCQDGSLLALNYQKYITLWDPYTCEIKTAFNSSFPHEHFVHLVFGHHSSSHYLMASSYHHLHVWDLLTCSVLWCVKVSVDLLLSDHFSSLAVAFVHSKETSHLYVFHPSSPTPLAVHSSVCKGEVVGGVFMPVEEERRDGKRSEEERWDGKRSELFFVNKKQVLYALKDAEEGLQGEATNKAMPMSTGQPAQRAFYEIFGDTVTQERRSGPSTATAATPTNKSSKQMFNAPPHVLPPISTLCQSFLQTLLPTNKTSATIDDDDDLSDTGTGGHSSDGEEEGGRPSEANPPQTVSSMEVDEGCAQQTTAVGTYDWLVEFFRTL